ncbi:MAG TPA: YegS/Rv2252/BmrU family lipid kinase [Fimbriimonadaceae bacterium]
MPDPTDCEAVLLINTKSLKGQEWLEQAETKLKEKGVDLKFAKGYSRAGDLINRAQEEIGKNKLVIIGGGDGTLSAAANVFANTKTRMGVLPLGTGNAFARDLGIATDLDAAIDAIVDGEDTEVDVGVCNGKLFVNVVTIGITATVAKTLTVPLKRRFGRFVYAIALGRALKEMKPFRSKIETENGVTEIDAVEVVIGNGRYHAGPLPLSPTASITSGKLLLYAVEAGSKVNLLKYALLLPSGLQGVLKTVHSEDTKGGKISTIPNQTVVMDGELAFKTPLDFHIEHAALKVRVPKKFKG